MSSLLEIKSLVLPVCIGRFKEERKKAQEVAFSIKVLFLKDIKDEKTDQLENSVCYSLLVEKLSQRVKGKNFSLIEKLAFEAFVTLRPLLPSFARLELSVCKLKPPLAGLKGGVTYTLGDLDKREVLEKV